MNCLKCQARTDVYDTRAIFGQGVRRKRKCQQCGFRFATIEAVDTVRELKERKPKPARIPRLKKARISRKPAASLSARRTREMEEDTDLGFSQDLIEVARELGIEGFR